VLMLSIARATRTSNTITEIVAMSAKPREWRAVDFMKDRVCGDSFMGLGKGGDRRG
jgi:hypothetical protein